MTGGTSHSCEPTDGGFARLNKVFDGQLESLLGELADEVWKDAG